MLSYFQIDLKSTFAGDLDTSKVFANKTFKSISVI